MNRTTHRATSGSSNRPARPARRWPALLGVLLAFLAVGGLPVETLADANPGGRAAHARPGPAPASRRADIARADAVAAASDTVRGVAADGADARPSFQATFVRAEDGQAGQPYSYTVRVRNDGGAAGAVRVTTSLPPAFSNVRVTAPGFACTRQFTASGSDAGTLVSCLRNELAVGSAAEVTVEANAPSTTGTYRITAAAGARDADGGADDTPPRATASIDVRG